MTTTSPTLAATDIRTVFARALATSDAVPVPDDAPLIDRLVAWNGRRP